MRHKDDADRLKRHRDKRRQLIDDIASTPHDEFDELSEVTRPDIQIHVHHPGQPALKEAPETPSKLPPVLRAPLIALEGLPTKHRLWGFLALTLALLIGYLASRGLFR